MYVALDVLRNVLGVPDGDIPDDLYRKLNDVICESLLHVDDQICGKIAGTVLPQIFINSTKETKIRSISLIWSQIQHMFTKYGQKTFRTKAIHPLSERPLMLLCGLADWLFPVDDVMALKTPVVSEPGFWIILQSGFFHFNPLTRKRALYLLKRILDTVEQQGKPVESLKPPPESTEVTTSEPLFWWDPQHAAELSAIWQNFILLIESVAEKQVNFS